MNRPAVFCAYGILEIRVLDEGENLEAALAEIVTDYELTECERDTILGWLDEEIAVLEGDSAAQVRLDEDH